MGQVAKSLERRLSGVVRLWPPALPTPAPLLRASHIVPWSACTSGVERLDPENDLLLSAFWDAAFDRGLVTFENDGTPRFPSSLSPAARAVLHWSVPLPLTPRHRDHLAWHRANVFIAATQQAP